MCLKLKTTVDFQCDIMPKEKLRLKSISLFELKVNNNLTVKVETVPDLG